MYVILPLRIGNTTLGMLEGFQAGDRGGYRGQSDVARLSLSSRLFPAL